LTNLVKRGDVLKKIRKGAKRAGVQLTVFEGTRHTRLDCGGTLTTVPRHTEVPDRLVEAIFKQLEGPWGKGWWK
jgi:hypothetical protein